MRVASLLAAAVFLAYGVHAAAQAGPFERGLELERAGKVREAVLIYREAARGGDPKAARRLGEIYAGGRGDEPADPEKARRFKPPPLIGDFPNPR
jgi:TPR repeat protein